MNTFAVWGAGAHGQVAFAGTAVNPGAPVGMACILDTCASVDHDRVIGDGVPIRRCASGRQCPAGEASWVGIGASVRQGITLGLNTMVMAGAAVVHSFMGGMTLVGVPARPLERKTTC